MFEASPAIRRAARATDAAAFPGCTDASTQAQPDEIFDATADPGLAWVCRCCPLHRGPHLLGLRLDDTLPASIRGACRWSLASCGSKVDEDKFISALAAAVEHWQQMRTARASGPYEIGRCRSG
jgi:hypothetical protein